MDPASRLQSPKQTSFQIGNREVKAVQARHVEQKEDIRNREGAADQASHGTMSHIDETYHQESFHFTAKQADTDPKVGQVFKETLALEKTPVKFSIASNLGPQVQKAVGTPDALTLLQFKGFVEPGIVQERKKFIAEMTSVPDKKIDEKVDQFVANAVSKKKEAVTFRVKTQNKAVKASKNERIRTIVQSPEQMNKDIKTEVLHFEHVFLDKEDIKKEIRALRREGKTTVSPEKSAKKTGEREFPTQMLTEHTDFITKARSAVIKDASDFAAAVQKQEENLANKKEMNKLTLSLAAADPENSAIKQIDRDDKAELIALSGTILEAREKLKGFDAKVKNFEAADQYITDQMNLNLDAEKYKR